MCSSKPTWYIIFVWNLFPCTKDKASLHNPMYHQVKIWHKTSCTRYKVLQAMEVVSSFTSNVSLLPFGFQTFGTGFNLFWVLWLLYECWDPFSIELSMLTACSYPIKGPHSRIYFAERTSLYYNPHMCNVTKAEWRKNQPLQVNYYDPHMCNVTQAE